MLQQKQGMHTAAIRAQEHAIALHPQSPQHHYNLGNVYMEKLDIPAAAKSFTKALELDSAYWKAANNLGNVLTVLGDTSGAEAAYRKCIRHHPTHTRALKNLGLIVRDQAKLERSHAKLEAAVELFQVRCLIVHWMFRWFEKNTSHPN